MAKKQSLVRLSNIRNDDYLEFVTGGVELLRAVLHGYAGGLIFMK
jgi:hypothetical protein